MYNAIYDSLIIAKKVIYLPTCHSTNDIAAEIVRDPSYPEGTVVIADEQTKGKGQRGTIWITEPGKNLTLSIALRPHFISLGDQFLVSQAMAVAVASYLRQHAQDVKIKWPNDIYLSDRKICGILIENAIQGTTIATSVAGIGVNVNQTNFGEVRATSLSAHLGHSLALPVEFEKLMREIDAAYLKLRSAGGRAMISAAYLELLYDNGVKRNFRVNEQIRPGVITGITSAGKLCIRFENQEEPVAFGNKEVEWVWE